MTPQISCVIVTHNSESELSTLLRSLETHLGERAEVIVVDSGSRDGSLVVADRSGAKTFSLPENPGFGMASNLGVSQATAPTVALLNPDIELRDDALLALGHLATQRQALFAPRLLNSDGSVQRSAHPKPGRRDSIVAALWPPAAMPERLANRLEPWRSERPVAIGWAIAACLVASTETLRQLGPFDPDIFLYYEDLDLSLRAAAVGIPTLLEPQVAVMHSGGHSTERSFRGEPFDLLAKQRRSVILKRLGPRALKIDDISQRLTFTTRRALKQAMRRDAQRERQQLSALRAARRAQ